MWITNSKPRKRGRNRFTATHMQVAKWLHVMADRFNRCAAKLNATDIERWANELRLAEEVDGIDLRYATDALKWAYGQDRFWRDVIASPSGLRRNWPQLESKYREHQKALLNH